MAYYRPPYPFKKPFKGKRVSLRDLDDLIAECQHLDRQMAALIERWTEHKIPGISLVIHKQGSPTLRWRLSAKVYGKQRYAELFGDESPLDLRELTQETVHLLLGYENRRLLLNAKARAARTARDAFQTYCDRVRELESYLFE